ncbi:MAG: hypothetical protein HKN36_08135 [Hellea sp.]|nr:hypothetical protein [Hellea sp.]
MQSDFFDASQGGDPAYFQHLIWYFSHPETWLMFLKWAVILVAVILIGRRLFERRRMMLLMVFLVAVAAGLYYNFHVMKQAHQLFIEGRGHEAVSLRILNWATLFLAFAAAAWIIILRVKKRS